MSTPIIRGQSGIHPYHTTGRVQIADGTTKTIVKQGLFKDLEAILPSKGSVFEGVTVKSAELARKKGGMGILTVVGAPSSGAGGVALDDDGTVYEVEMAQLEKPLMSLPELAGYVGQIEMWRAAEPAMRAQYKYFDDENDLTELEGQARWAAELILKGVESYLVFSPVCRRTTPSDKPAERAFGGIGGDCGKKQRPPEKLLRMTAGSWQWLKTADRAEEKSGGGSTRVEEWTGADEWSDLLYKEALSVAGGGR